MKKKNGEIAALVGTGLILFSLYVFFNKKKYEHFVSENSTTLENYINRLREYDTSPTKDASNLFFDLIECGFSPANAFASVQKEIDDMGKWFR